MAQHSTAQHSTAQHSTAQHSTAQHSTAQQGLHEHQPDPLSQLLSHEREAVRLQSAAYQSSTPDSTKDNAPGLDHALHLGMVWIVEDAQDIGQGQCKGWHDDSQPC